MCQQIFKLEHDWFPYCCLPKLAPTCPNGNGKTRDSYVFAMNIKRNCSVDNVQSWT